MGSEIECPKYTSVSDSNVKKVLEGYKTYASKDEINKKYILCPSVSKFDNDGIISVSDEIKINHTDVDYSLVIYGLNLTNAQTNQGTNALLQLSGSNITLDHAILTGTPPATGQAGTGTALKIDAKDVTINSANISKFATAIETTNNSEKAMIKNVTISDGGIIFAGIGHKIESSALTGIGTGTAIQVNGAGVAIGPAVAIDNFEKGVFIKSGATAKITQDSIKVKGNLITDALSFETAVSSAFSESLIGKHLSEADSNYADKFIGQLSGKTVNSCIGSVEILFKNDDLKTQQGGTLSQGATGMAAPFNHLVT
ncbi:MAG: hypothetical protein HYY43_04725 [Deltaproteobacteria bacterium]|nr:hypothetical protein [Deltaproteobacteria bacterium]